MNNLNESYDVRHQIKHLNSFTFTSISHNLWKIKSKHRKGFVAPRDRKRRRNKARSAVNSTSDAANDAYCRLLLTLFASKTPGENSFTYQTKFTEQFPFRNSFMKFSAFIQCSSALRLLNVLQILNRQSKKNKTYLVFGKHHKDLICGFFANMELGLLVERLQTNFLQRTEKGNFLCSRLRRNKP